MLKFCTWPSRNDANALPVPVMGVPVDDRLLVRMLLNWKEPVGFGGCKISKCSKRQSIPIFRLWRPRNQEKLSTICVTDVVKLALPFVVGPSCWKPTTLY